MPASRHPSGRALAAALLLAAGAAPALAWAAEADPGLPPATVALAAADLLDQDGAPVRFPGEALDGRIVVVDFVFTSCTTVCPLLTAKLVRLQERLGDRLGREVRLVTLTLDPIRDRPERLKAFAGRFQARPGWTWLTGRPGEVERVLRGLGGYAADVPQHAPQVLVGDPVSGRWTRFNGFPDPERLLAAVDAFAAARAAATARN